MKTEFRIDFTNFDIPTPEISSEGFATFWVAAARIGNQVYANSDGTLRVENRPESAVADAASLETFAHKPVTLKHPPGMVTTENAKSYQVGFTHSDVRYDKGLVRVLVTLTDAEAIAAIKAKTHRQISAGYRASIVPIPGVWQGEPYDCQQSDISVNHIALVPEGRAGELCSAHFDGIDVPVAIQKNIVNQTLKIMVNEASEQIAKSVLNIDGLDVNMTEMAAIAVNAKLRADALIIASSRSQIEDLTNQCNELRQSLDIKAEFATTLESDVARLKTDLIEATTKLDSVEGANLAHTAKIEQLESYNLELERQKVDAIDPASIHQMVQARVSLEKNASFFIDDPNLPNMTDMEIMRAVVSGQYGDRVNLDSRSDEFIKSAFEIATSDKKTTTSTTGLRKETTDAVSLSRTVTINDESDEIQIRRDTFTRLKKNSQLPLAGNLNSLFK